MKRKTKSEFFFFLFPLVAVKRKKKNVFSFPFLRAKHIDKTVRKLCVFFFFNLTAPNCISVTKFALLTPNFAGATFHSYFLLTLC